MDHGVKRPTRARAPFFPSSFFLLLSLFFLTAVAQAVVGARSSLRSKAKGRVAYEFRHVDFVPWLVLHITLASGTGRVKSPKAKSAKVPPDQFILKASFPRYRLDLAQR